MPMPTTTARNPIPRLKFVLIKIRPLFLAILKPGFRLFRHLVTSNFSPKRSPRPFWERHAHGPSACASARRTGQAAVRGEVNENSQVTHQAIFGHMTSDGQIAWA